MAYASAPLTLLIHPLPIAVYRYAVLKAPMEPKKAKKVVIVDAIIVAAVTAIIVYSSGGTKVSFTAVVFWSFVCHWMLTHGYKTPIKQAASEDENESFEQAEPVSTIPDLANESRTGQEGPLSFSAIAEETERHIER